MSMRSNVEQIVASWEKREKKLAPYMRRATKQATDVFYAEARKQMTAGIYDKPVPTNLQNAERKGIYTERNGQKVPAMWRRNKAGRPVKFPVPKELESKPAWKVTGKLRRSEKRKVVTPFAGIVWNAASYAKARHEMGKPTAKLKTDRRCHWRDTAIRITRPRVRRIYRDALASAVRAGVVSGVVGGIGEDIR